VTKAVLKHLPLDRIDPHPQNPRVALREDVVEGIRASLNGEMSEEHALHVRPVGERYQIVGGHQRHEAARRAGLKAVPCWVRAMTDEEAYLALVLDNRQGELYPLEIGIHALEVVGKAQGKKGKGCESYAKLLGVSGRYIRQIVDAARVVRSANLGSQLPKLLDKTQHLYAISGLPEALWPGAVAVLVGAGGKMSVADVEKKVKLALDFLGGHGIPDDWQNYLPPGDCGLALFGGTDPNNFRRLLALAVKVLADLPEDLAAEWRAWLVENKGGDSWDIAKCQQKRVELEDRLAARDITAELAPAASVVLADPPWQYDFAETDSRQVENQYPTATVAEIVSHGDGWPLAADCVLFLWATAPKLREALEVMDGLGFEYKTHFVWYKERVGMGYWARGQHELLLVGTRGKAGPPPPESRFPSVFRERRPEEHSRKPECVYRAIESMFPFAVKGEAYVRGEVRPGWVALCGNEVTQ
jgi:ParB/RepB/Spo0J family partition protein